MSKIWPPSPMVEDEVLSLAKEHFSDLSDSQSSEDIPPAESRGAVDQYPLIIDVKDTNSDSNPKGQQKEIKNPHVNTPRKEQGTGSTSETRFVHIPSASDNEREPDRGPRRPRSKSTIGIAMDEDPRGRPQVSRINTDLGADLHAMATGRRRAPSPYSYKASTSTLLPSMLDDTSKVSLLSPESAASLPLPVPGRRARSQRPDRLATKGDGSDSDRRRKDYARRRSKSRHDCGSFSKSSGDERMRLDRARYEPRRSERSPPRDQRYTTSQRTPMTPPETPGPVKESPYASAAEDSDRQRQRDRYRVERRQSKESAYPSAKDDRQARREHDDRYRTKSRRQSMHRSTKPPIDLCDQRNQVRPETPLSARAPRSLEADLEQAFKDNQKKPPRTYGHNEGPSPLHSAPTSPPRTPRGDRKSKDYFEMTAPVSNMSRQRTRPPSTSENPLKPMTTLLSAATMGAATLAAKTVPDFSRSSTTSVDSPSTGSQGSFASCQRSRKPSPVYDEPQVLSRNNSTAGRDGLAPSRAGPVPAQDDRPVSRAGSVASQDGGKNHSATPLIYEERPPSRNGLTATPAPHPPAAHRTSSYSTIPEQAHLRPSAHRTYTTTTGSAAVHRVGPQGRLQHSHLSQPPYMGSPYVSSPASESIADILNLQSTSVLEKSVHGNSEQPKRQISFPLCAHNSPVAGPGPWYRLEGLSNFDICSNCTRVLGESSLRDNLVPAAWKSPNEPATCALGQPWIRIVIAKCLKDSVANLGLLQSLTSRPPDIYPCPGRQAVVRRWYHVLDPETKAPVQGFNACTSCVRNAELIFPELWKEKIFERPEGKLAQERFCNLYTDSKHFYGIVNQLDILAGYSKKKDLRKKDITKFADYVRQKARYRECARDAMLATPLWHFIPSLPEMTICEECYMGFVFPLHDKPIARDVSMALQKVPVQRPAHYVAGISCQLYSDRMRKVFREAVTRNDFETLKTAALQRYNVEHKLQDYHRRFELEQQMGYDRRGEIEQNAAAWRRYE